MAARCPKPHIGKTATSDRREGFIFGVENQVVPPFPNIPSNCGDNRGSFKACEGRAKQVGEGEVVLVSEVEPEEPPDLPCPVAGENEVIDILV
jgi:hypothetical protein